MKTISPISIWKSGNTTDATILKAYVISDDLSAYAIFYYALLSESLEVLAEGNLKMEGTDYDEYETNQYAWDWIPAQLNVTVTGDYIEPETPDLGEDPILRILPPDPVKP